MKSKIINFINSKIDFTNNSSEYEERVKYGIEVLYILISKTVLIFTLSFFLGLFSEMTTLFFIYFPLRSLSGGLHLNSSNNCTVLSIFYLILIAYGIKLIAYNEFLFYLSFFTLFFLHKYSPADTHKRPIISGRKKRKLATFAISLLYILLSYTYKTSIFILPLFLQVFMIHPISYFLFGLTYDNYLKFKKEVIK